NFLSNTRRIMILGKTGSGKSSLANTIFGEELFTIGHNSDSETSECQAKTKSRSEEELKREILKCITECAPGPHAFLIVLKVERFTEQEQAVITTINQHFSEEVLRYATVVFTHGNQLEEGQTIEDFVGQNKISNLVKKCGDRCHVVDNKYWKNNQQDEYRSNQFQVKELLNTIEKIVEANQGSCYTNEMLQTVEDVIQQEVEAIRPSSGNMSEEEIREQAKGSVFEKLLIKLAGILTGVVLGALFGVILLPGEVINVLKKYLSEERALIKIAATAATAMACGGAVGGSAAGGGVTALAGSIVGVTAAAGALKGGFTGYNAAKGAGTPLEAAKRTAEVFKDDALSVFKAQDITAKIFKKMF
uniref:AIG1-type G domain-containing protein n=1 Tax=Sander lucioperca TaxID=283035 RepID=A0A8C9X8P9_SANLU